MLSRASWNEASPGLILCTGAHQGSLGRRLALGLYSTLALTVLNRRTSNSFCLRRLNVSSSNSVRQKRCHCNITHTTTVEVQVHGNHTKCIQIRRVCTKDVTTWANSILNWFPSMSLGTRLSLGLYSTLVLTRGAWERGKPRDCTLHWCSPGEPGNKASPGIAYSALVLSRGTWNEASPGLILCSGAHQGSLGTRIALGLYSILVLTVLIRRTSNSFCFCRSNISSSNSVRQ